MPVRTDDIADWTPERAWRELVKDQNVCLVDVRSRAEWNYVGIPDLSEIGRRQAFVEWQRFPCMTVNPGFVDAVSAALEADSINTILFLCRSGIRSRHAARAYSEECVAKGQVVTCVNLAEGFEGDLNDKRQRGRLNGWKAKGLPWRQS